MNKTNAVLEFFIVCEYAHIDDKGKLNLFGIFDNILAANFPALHPKLFIVAKWDGLSEGAHIQKIDLVGPSGKTIFSKEHELHPARNRKLQSVGEINLIKLDETGDYKFRMFLDEVFVKDLHITVQQQNT